MIQKALYIYKGSGHMSIERLTFTDEEFKYNPLEASIHVVRYQIAKELVKGKKVLDIACGEGYGSWLLKNWGAKTVIGVDIDQEAVDHANDNFSSKDVSFQCASAEQIDFKEKFDLIISLETIEHVEDQFQYLKNLKNMLSDEGVLIISCPNDHWYYNEDESNEYHLRKYTFDDFVKASESVLGEAKSWYLGSNIFGYGNFQYDKDKKHIIHTKQNLAMMDLVNQKDIPSTSISYNTDTYLPTEEKSLYYVGIWTNKDLSFKCVEGANIFPIPPVYTDIKVIDTIKTWADELEEAVEILRKDNDELRRFNKNIQLQKKALELENEIAKKNIHTISFQNTELQTANTELQIIYNKYQKIKKIIPTPLRKIIVKLFRSIKG